MQTGKVIKKSVLTNTNTKAKSKLPLISKLSDADSPDAGLSDEDMDDIDDDGDLGALNFHMKRSSMVGASSGRTKAKLEEDNLMNG